MIAGFTLTEKKSNNWSDRTSTSERLNAQKSFQPYRPARAQLRQSHWLLSSPPPRTRLYGLVGGRGRRMARRIQRRLLSEQSFLWFYRRSGASTERHLCRILGRFSLRGGPDRGGRLYLCRA